MNFFKVTQKGFFQIQFRVSVRQIQKLENVGVLELPENFLRQTFQGKGQFFISQHRPLEIGGVHLPPQLPDTQLVFDGKADVKFLFFDGLGRCQNVDVVRPANLCHQ